MPSASPERLLVKAARRLVPLRAAATILTPGATFQVSPAIFQARPATFQVLPTTFQVLPASFQVRRTSDRVDRRTARVDRRPVRARRTGAHAGCTPVAPGPWIAWYAVCPRPSTTPSSRLRPRSHSRLNPDRTPLSRRLLSAILADRMVRCAQPGNSMRHT